MIAPPQDAGLRPIILRLIPFLFVLYIVAYLDRVNVGFAQLEMKKDLGFSDRVYGLGSGIFFLGYFLFEVPSNLILERVGARRWIARIMLTWGIIAMAMVFTKTSTSFYVLRFLLGLAEAGFFPGVILYLTYWFTSAERGRIVGLLMTATAAANILGSPISGALLGVRGFGLAGWQWLFLLEGLPAVALALAVLVYLPDGPQQARWLTTDQKQWMAKRMEADHRAQPDRHVSLRAALMYPRVWQFAALYFALVVGMYGVTLWLPQIVKGFSHRNNFQVGLLTAIPYLLAAAGMVGVGIHSDARGERRLHVAIPAFIGAAGLLVSAFLHTPLLSLVAISVAAAGMWGTLGPFWALPPACLHGRAAAGGIALINSIGNLGGFVGPYLVGYIKEATHGFTGGLLFLAGSLFVGGLIALTTSQPPPLRPE